MAELSVSSLTIEEVIRKLKAREWLIPQFQRDFVWSVGDVIDLVHSILCARPIGMATIWEQAEESSLELGPISLPDRIGPGNVSEKIEFCSSGVNPSKNYAVLDGLQRCTAIAMAFGGFHSTHGTYKVSGRYYLNVAALDPLEQIVFFKEAEVIANKYNNDATCISQGLFPLSSNIEGEPILAQWLRYIQAIKVQSYYTDGQLPDEPELDRRDRLLKEAFEGLTKTKLAVYLVPETYSLADICDIFEKLNTTGTKVSTVDLIHSWLYADTATDAEGSIQLRDWIDDFGQKDGAIGWAASNDRPELLVQITTACYVALEEKPPPRKVGRATTPLTIASVKAGDLLATPTEHWKTIINKDDILANYLGDFQRVVSVGLFSWKTCPYPVSAAIYVALRLHSHFDSPDTHPWGQDDLNALFRAFFWKNALSNRYDQGFLTQLGADIKELKAMLKQRQNYNSASQWATDIEKSLHKLISKPLPNKEELVDYLTDGRPGGAMQKALLLPMVAGADKDLLDENIKLGFPESAGGIHLHHIYPKGWCKNNVSGDLINILDKTKAGRDWVNSIANLMPLSRQSNNIWKAKIPGQALLEKGISYKHSAKILQNAYIDETSFNFLLSGAEGIKDFWERRAEAIAEDLLSRTKITI